MPQIRVFVVDDSVVFRRQLLQCINSIPGVRTIGVAGNGREALDAIPLIKPDLITLDINMPVMDGLETLRLLHEVYPKFRVIMVSAFTCEGAQATLEALEAGALDFITKPDGDDEECNSKLLRDQFSALLAKYIDHEIDHDTKAAKTATVELSTFAHQYPISIQHPPCVTRPEVVAIGISTGGPNALMKLLPDLSADFPLPILIVQHMPRLFTRTLAESLAKKSKVAVVEAVDGSEVKAGTAYIAPGGTQMKVHREGNGKVHVQITDAAAENHCKPSADYLFRSVAQVYGGKSLGVIMTGMGSDGVLGLRLMKRQGSRVIAQDRDTCTIWGMPRMALEAGVVDLVLPLHEIASELQRITKGTR